MTPSSVLGCIFPTVNKSGGHSDTLSGHLGFSPPGARLYLVFILIFVHFCIQLLLFDLLICESLLDIWGVHILVIWV